MPKAEALQMHSEFPRWYRAVDLGDDPGRVERRWAGAVNVVKAATRADVEGMVRLAFRTRQGAAAATVQRIREAFRSADDQFEMQGNGRELEVLCSASLATLLQRKGTNSAVAALAITTAGLAGARKPELPMDLVNLAEGAVVEIAESQRQPSRLTRPTAIVAPKFDFEKAAVKVREQSWEAVALAFGLAADATRAALATLVQREVEAAEAASTIIAMQREELQMLWWLVGERSWDFDCAFDSVPADARPLVLAKELAQVTEFLPGPSSVKALLSRAGLKDQERMAIPTMVNGASPDWLARLVENEDPSPVTQPIHFAIKRKLETGDTSAWVAGWGAATEIDVAHLLSPLAVSSLFYRERLLILFPEN